MGVHGGAKGLFHGLLDLLFAWLLGCLQDCLTFRSNCDFDRVMQFWDKQQVGSARNTELKVVESKRTDLNDITIQALHVRPFWFIQAKDSHFRAVLVRLDKIHSVLKGSCFLRHKWPKIVHIQGALRERMPVLWNRCWCADVWGLPRQSLDHHLQDATPLFPSKFGAPVAPQPLYGRGKQQPLKTEVAGLHFKQTS